MRLFVAVELPNEIKDYVVEIGKHLKEFRLRFVRPEHMHITLAFLGETADKDAEDVQKKLSDLKFKPFTLKTQSFGFFPSSKNVRIVWLGIEHNPDFIKLQHDIRTGLGHKEKFMPHLTIARAREIITRDAHMLNEAMNKLEIKSFTFQVEKFALFKSELMPAGPIHTIMQEFSAELNPS